MSSTTSSTSAAASCTGNAWVLPVQDVACAVKTDTGNYSSIMEKCCGVAEVQSYNDDCGLFCLAQGQDGNALLDCIGSNGAEDGDYFCGGNLTQTATAPVPSPTGDDSDNDNDNDNDNDASDATSTGDASEPTNTDNAGVRLQDKVVSTSGLGVLAMVFCSAVFGVFA